MKQSHPSIFGNVMIRSILLFVMLAQASVLSAQSPNRPTVAAKLLPDSTIVYVELTDVKKLVATVFDHPLRPKIEALPVYQQATDSQQYKQGMLGIEMLENLFGMNWREAIETFASDGVVFAVDGASKGAAVIVDGKDETSMAMFRDRAIGLAQNQEVQSVEYRGIKAHRINDARVAVHGDRLLVTNNSDFGKAILDRMLDGDDENLLSSKSFQDAVQTRSAGSIAWAFADIETVRESGVADDIYHDQINNPVLELLVGAIQSNLQHTPFATADLFVATDRVALKLAVPHNKSWIPEEREYFFGPTGDGRGLAVPDVDQTLFTFSTYRDFAQMWLRAGDLFNAEINDGFAKADANLTTFFSGKDFGEDILGSLKPSVAFVAARQDFQNKKPQPAIKLPAFGLLMELKEPEKMTREMRRTFQSLIGFYNVIGAMEGLNQLEMDMEKSDGVQFVSSSFIPEEDDRESMSAPIAFNFSPTAGFAGERFVVASTTELAKQLTMAKIPDDKQIADNTAENLHAGVLRQVLEDNREQLIAQNMLEDGNTREEAETQIGLILQFIEYFRDASLRLGQRNDRLEAELEIRIAQ